MNRNLKALRGIILSVVYIFSLICFMVTSAFSEIENVTRSSILAVVAVNLTVTLIIFMGVILGIKLNNVLFGVYTIMCMPSVLSQSKLNWVENIWGINIQSNMPPVLVSLFVFVVVVGCVVTSILTKYDEQYMRFEALGARSDEVAEVSRNQFMVLLYVIAAMSIIINIVIISAFFISELKGDWINPVLLALLGIGLVIVCIWYYVRKVYKDKPSQK